MRTRAEHEAAEARRLAPCAVRASESRGRAHPEVEHPLRSAFERDRDRIIHSSAFRKLEYKTQVFVNHEGDYYRTRLTHTLEAAQITRSLARFLHLNEDLAEAYKWLTLASEGGDARARRLCEAIGGELSTRERWEARRRAHEWNLQRQRESDCA